MLGNKLIKAAAGNAAVAEETDEHFQNTVLLLHGDGNQGATNYSNTGSPSYLAFKDNSSNNFPITVNGDAYGDNFGPYALEDGNWSNFFDGSGSAGWVYTPQSSAFTFDGDFTISAWVYLTKLSTTSDLIGTTNNRVFIGSGNSGWTVNINTSGQLRFGYMSSNSWVFDSNLGITVPLNQFVHIAVVRSGSTITGYVGGVAGSSPITSSATLTSNLYGVYIGDGAGSAGNNTDGYVSNVHIQKGTAINYASVGVPSSPESITAYTSLLTCQSNRYKDNSTNSFTVTPGGGSTNVAVKAFNPFDALPDGVNGSAYFDGTGDWVTAPNDAGYEFTGDFTIELWVYTTRSTNQEFGTGTSAAFMGGGNSGWHIQIFNSSNALTFTNQVSNSFPINSALESNAALIPLNAWNYIVVSRVGSTIRGFINGVQTSSTITSSSTISSNQYLSIGSGWGGNYPFQGHISNVKIVDGTGVTSVTVPTSPATKESGTTILTTQYAGTVRNVGFIDSGPYDFPITRYGNTTQGTFSPFSKSDGAWGNYFDGSGDYLSLANNAAFALWSGDFTIEAWIYRAAGGAEQYLFSMRDTGGYEWRINATNLMQFFFTGGSSITSSGSIPINAWTHLAVSRETNTVRFFINGALDSSATFSNGGSSTASLFIGYGTTGGGYFSGQMSNARIVKGAAVYTSAFTPSTSPLTAISGTSLLTCQSNRFVDNSSNAFAITAAGNVAVTPFSPFPITTAYSPSVNGGAGYFDGSGDYIQTPANPAFNCGTANFTMSFWTYRTSNTSQILVSRQVSASGWGNIQWYLSTDASGNMVFTNSTGAGPSNFWAGGTIPLNAWCHVEIVRDSSAPNGWRVFVDGISRAYALGAGITHSMEINTNATPLNIGGFPGWGHTYGYITDFQLLPGYVAHTSDFTPPTAPATSINETSILCNFTNAGILDNTCSNALETVGNAQMDTSVVKFGTGSMKFDGTGDYLRIKSSQDFDVSSGNFTIEGWVYTNTVAAGLANIVTRSNGTGGAYGPFLIGRSGANFVCRISSANASWDIANATSGIGTLTVSTFHHFALVRNGSSFTFYVDGVGTLLSTSSASFIANTDDVLVGAIFASSSVTEFWDGFIDDLRITKGVARYTANFTPPDKALPNIGV